MKLGMIIAAINGKSVYDSVDNQEFMEKLILHPNFKGFMDTILDTVVETSTSDKVVDNLSNYRGLITEAIINYNGQGDFNFMQVVNSVMATSANASSDTQISNKDVIVTESERTASII